MACAAAGMLLQAIIRASANPKKEFRNGAIICLTFRRQVINVKRSQSGGQPLPDRPNFGVKALQEAPNDRTVHNQACGSKCASVRPGDKTFLSEVEDLELSQQS